MLAEIRDANREAFGCLAAIVSFYELSITAITSLAWRDCHGANSYAAVLRFTADRKIKGGE